MSVQAKLGIVRKVRAELQEERAEIPVHAVDVIVIDHGRRPDQPGIRGAGLFIAPPLGAKYGRFLLSLADEQHALGGELLPVGGSHIVFALALLELHRTGGELVTPMKSEEAGHSSRPLQRRHVHVQVHAVDSFDLQRHVLLENLCDRP